MADDAEAVVNAVVAAAKNGDMTRPGWCSIALPGPAAVGPFGSICHDE